MCSIFGSKDYRTFLKTAHSNQYRGSFSYSVSIFKTNGDFEVVERDFGYFNDMKVPKSKDIQYYLGHVQAPTGGLIKTKDRIHPAEENGNYLFHNGILKKSWCDSSWFKNGWDTNVLLSTLNYTCEFNLDKSTNLSNILSTVDGSFGCVYISLGKIYLFTTDIITIFINDNCDLSSIKTKTIKTRIEPNTIFELDLSQQCLVSMNNFTSLSSPYFFASEK